MTFIVDRLEINRYETISVPNLRAWNAADEMLVDYFDELSVLKKANPIILNDRFGYLTAHLYTSRPSTFCHLRSQMNSIEKNLVHLGFQIQSISPLLPLENWKKTQLVLMQMPKSLEFFEWLLVKSAQALTEDGQMVVGFMTKYFSEAFLKIAGKYFAEVHQSKALKKARLLILKSPLTIEPIPIFKTEIEFEGMRLHQYPGVFSKDRIDSATQFLVEHIQISAEENTMLDLACGNAVIAAVLKSRYPWLHVCAADDFKMAIESAKLNLSEADEVIWSNGWSNLVDRKFDVIVTNPPFHFEYEVNLMVPIQMMLDAYDHLNPGGSLWIVSNRHINYKSQLEKKFRIVEIVQQNKKFEITRAVR